MKISKTITRCLVLSLAWILIGLVPDGNAANEDEKMNHLSHETVEKIFQQRIYFAHQSVGKNILHGIELLVPEKADQIIELSGSDTVDSSRPAFYHSRVGSNSDIKSKIDGFGRAIGTSFSGKVDIAFVKLCYLDITADSDIEKLFNFYVESIESLQKKYPEVKFVHLTVPLMTNRSSWKTQVKKLLGKDNIWEYADNISRNRYNQLILKKYMGKEPVFDLAQVESTYPDGSREIFTFKSETYYALVKEYSRDGAHLNEFGSKIVGAALIEFLAGL